MPKINLLYVITKLELGGAQKQLLSLIARLDKNRYNIFLFTAKNGLLLTDAQAINGLHIKTSALLERPINPFKDILALIEIYLFIRKHNIDIVHTHSSKAGILGRLAASFVRNKIIIHTIHGWSFNDYQSGLCRYFFILLERFNAKFSDKLIVVSTHDFKKGLSSRIGNDRKYQLIHYGIDYSEFARQDNKIREKLGIKPNELVVGMLSCFKPQKSPQDFIKLAFLINQNLSDIKFILVGDGLLRKRIERLIAQLGLRQKVILTGWRRDIPSILQAMDVFVLTSLWEGLPISVLEAICASVPVVATNTGGISEVISEGKTGFLISPADTKNPGDMRTMAEKVISLLKDVELRQKIAKHAKESLSPNFNLENMVNNTDNFYRNLITAKINAG